MYVYMYVCIYVGATECHLHLRMLFMAASTILIGCNYIAVVMYTVISDVWEEGEVPKDWRDAIMIPLYKGKGAGKAKCVGITEAFVFCRQLERYWQVYFYHDSMPKS